MRPEELDFSSSATPGAAERFDRVWATTRPAEPSAELLDALWAQASAELDRIEAVGRLATTDQVIPVGQRRGQRRIVAGVMMAQAAAVLIAVGFVWAARRGEPAPVGPVVIVPPNPAIEPAGSNPTEVAAVERVTWKPMVVVGAEQTLVVRIDGSGHRLDFLDQPPMFPTMVENTPHDFFNALEIAANQ